MKTKLVLVFLHISKALALNAQQAKFLVVISRARLFILTPLFSFNGPVPKNSAFRDMDRGESDVICSLA